MLSNQFSLSCLFDDHYQNPIIGVCVNKECQSKRPYCPICEHTQHETHKDKLISFDSLEGWFSSNSILEKKLKKYQDDLIQIVKKLSYLLHTTQQKFLEMNFTDLNNCINNQFTLWDDQRNMCTLLQEMFSDSVKKKIKNISSQNQELPKQQVEQKKIKIVEVSQQQGALKQEQNLNGRYQSERSSISPLSKNIRQVTKNLLKKSPDRPKSPFGREETQLNKQAISIFHNQRQSINYFRVPK